MRKRTGAIGNHPFPANSRLNAVDNSRLIVELSLCNVFLQTQKECAMNKGELVDAVADKASVTKKQADAVLSAALEAIMEAVSDGDKVTLVGFGTFSVRKRGARTGRNPRTGETVAVDAKKVPYFKPGKEMRERLNLQEVTAE